jgi:hypothetical protein
MNLWHGSNPGNKLCVQHEGAYSLRKVRAFLPDGRVVFTRFVRTATTIRLMRLLLLREGGWQQRVKRISGKLTRQSG